MKALNHYRIIHNRDNRWTLEKWGYFVQREYINWKGKKKWKYEKEIIKKTMYGYTIECVIRDTLKEAENYIKDIIKERELFDRQKKIGIKIIEEYP
jgi:hypothetical protein